MKALFWLVVWVGLGIVEHVWAVDKSYSNALKRIEIKGSGSRGTSGDYLVPVLLGIGAIVLIVGLYRVVESRKKEKKAQPVAAVSGSDFKKHAAQIGFRHAEVRLLKVLAEKISPHNLVYALETDAGRHKLVGEVTKRIRRRERELLVLRGIGDKLGLVGQGHMKERETLRVEAHLPVWLVPHLGSDTAEEEWEEAEQVEGQLLDLSEGGAALRAQLDLSVGNQLEFWSADAQVWLAPTAARVLRVEERQKERVFHLQFIDPPSEELRAAIRTLQIEEAQARGG